jgi:hypothetical protein
VLQEKHNIHWLPVSIPVATEIPGEHGPAPAAGLGEGHMDLVTIAVVGVIIVSYVVGSLTSSVDIEEKLPHRY